MIFEEKKEFNQKIKNIRKIIKEKRNKEQIKEILATIEVIMKSYFNILYKPVKIEYSTLLILKTSCNQYIFNLLKSTFNHDDFEKIKQEISALKKDINDIHNKCLVNVIDDNKSINFKDRQTFDQSEIKNKDHNVWYEIYNSKEKEFTSQNKNLLTESNIAENIIRMREINNTFYHYSITNDEFLKNYDNSDNFNLQKDRIDFVDNILEIINKVEEKADIKKIFDAVILMNAVNEHLFSNSTIIQRKNLCYHQKLENDFQLENILLKINEVACKRGYFSTMLIRVQAYFNALNNYIENDKSVLTEAELKQMKFIFTFYINYLNSRFNKNKAIMSDLEFLTKSFENMYNAALLKNSFFLLENKQKVK